MAAAISEGRAILESLGAEPLLARLSAAEESAASDARIRSAVAAPGASTSQSTAITDDDT